MHSILSDNVPLTVSVSTLIAIGIETAPTKRSTTAKLEIRMFEFVCNFLIFMTATITNIFKHMVGGLAATVTAIASWREMFPCEFRKNGDMFRPKFDNLEELSMEFSAVFMFVTGMQASNALGRRGSVILTLILVCNPCKLNLIPWLPFEKPFKIEWSPWQQLRKFLRTFLMSQK